MDQTLTPFAATYGQSTAEAALQPYLDGFAHQERTEQELTLSLTSICSKEPRATWQALSLLDQYHRRGVLTTTLFRELKRQLNVIAFGSGGAHLTPDGQTYARARTPRTASLHSAQPGAAAKTLAHGSTEFSTAMHTQSHDNELHTSSLHTSSLHTSSLLTNSLQTSALRTSTLESRDAEGQDHTQARADFSAAPLASPADIDPSSVHDPGLYAASDTSLDSYLDAHPDPVRDANLAADWTHSDSLTPRYAADTASRYEWIDAEPESNMTLPRSLQSQPVQVESAHLMRAPVRRAGTLLDDRYVLVEPITSGSISVVFKALDRQREALPESDRYVAIKCPQENVRNDPRAVAAFHFEYAQSQAISHPNIAKVYDFCDTNGGCYIAMELLQGESLGRLIERIAPRRLPTARALTIIREIGLALAHAHDQRVVHGNLQPNNVTLLRNGELRVSDFAQSAGWLAPDAPRAEPTDDLYSLACIAHELLCGCTPEEGVSTHATNTAGRPMYARHLSSQQWRALQNGLADHRKQRAGNVRRWLAELDLRNADIRLPELAALEAEIAGHGGLRKRWLAAGVAAGALLIGVGMFAWRANTPDAASNTAVSTIAPVAAADESQVSDPARLAELQAELLTPPPATVQSADSIRIEALNPMPATAGGVLLPTVTFTADRYEVNEHEGTARLIIRRSTPLDKELLLRWFTIAGTAQPGVDYVGFQYASVRMLPGERSAEVLIPLIPVERRDRAVSFDVRISATTEALPGKAVVTKVVILPTTSSAPSTGGRS